MPVIDQLIFISSVTCLSILILLTLMHHRYFFCVGDSMSPAMSSFCIGYGYATHDVKVGDIVAFHKKSAWHRIMHRIVLIEDDMVYIKGDNRDTIDIVPMSNIEFKVIKYKNVW
jgi:hypothetical protein